MTLEVDVFWSFRSPYSYLATPRLVDLAARYDVDVKLRVVYPLAIRDTNFFASVNPLWPPYLMRDVHRLGEFLGVPFRWPQPDPVVQEIADGRLVTSTEQPYIHRLSKLGVLAAERGRGLAFANEVSRIIWSGDVDGWHQGTHLQEATARAGLELAELDGSLRSEGERLHAEIEANQEAHQGAGHWGVPTCVFRGEPFFGQDRIDLLVWRLKQHGLENGPA